MPRVLRIRTALNRIALESSHLGASNGDSNAGIGPLGAALITFEMSELPRVVHFSIGEVCARAKAKAQIFFQRSERANIIYEIFFFCVGEKILGINFGSKDKRTLL